MDSIWKREIFFPLKIIKDSNNTKNLHNMRTLSYMKSFSGAFTDPKGIIPPPHGQA
jgi:hypothetical protein